MELTIKRERNLPTCDDKYSDTWLYVFKFYCADSNICINGAYSSEDKKFIDCIFPTPDEVRDGRSGDFGFNNIFLRTKEVTLIDSKLASEVYDKLRVIIKDMIDKYIETVAPRLNGINEITEANRLTKTE